MSGDPGCSRAHTAARPSAPRAAAFPRIYGHDARARRVGLARPRARHPSLVFSRGSPSPVLPRDFTTRTPSGIPRVVVAPRRVRSRRLRVPRPGRVLHARRQARGEHVVHRGRLPHDRGGAAPRERAQTRLRGRHLRGPARARPRDGRERDVAELARERAVAAAERAAAADAAKLPRRPSPSAASSAAAASAYPPPVDPKSWGPPYSHMRRGEVTP